MKKLLVSFIIILLSENYTLASNTLYDTELSKIRTIKNAKVSVLNKQIKEISENLVELELNTTMKKSEKEKRIQSYNKQLEELTTKKAEISEQYKRDKAILKKKYK